MKRKIYLEYDKQKPNLRLKFYCFLYNIPANIASFLLKPFYILKYKYDVKYDKKTRFCHNYWKSLGYKINSGQQLIECEWDEFQNLQKLLNEL